MVDEREQHLEIESVGELQYSVEALAFGLRQF